MPDDVPPDQLITVWLDVTPDVFRQKAALAEWRQDVVECFLRPPTFSKHVKVGTEMLKVVRG